jgi:hypothetical protein
MSISPRFNTRPPETVWRQRLICVLLLACLALPSTLTTAVAAFPTNPHYPQYKYPSVLDAPRGYGPKQVYGFSGPAYRWGWFGAQYRPRMVHHTGYADDYWQTGYRWGY